MNDMSRGPSPHFSVAKLSRTTGANAVERAARRHATRMTLATGQTTKDHSGEAATLRHAEIVIPEDAPRWAAEAYGRQAFRAAMHEISAATGNGLNAPERLAWARLSEGLWNDIEHVESVKNRKSRSALLAWEITAALPRVLSAEGRIRLVRDYAIEVLF